MSARESEPGPAAAPEAAPDTQDRKVEMSYEGTRVPAFVALVWIVFIVWGVAYLLRFVPPSVREWFFSK